ncbi:hypothetical protein FGIG_03708 [Fasciola gigantica]|uniref:Uncharacterized protein n=1 Tax=Fasciola gigantica TaxID=46835 RepID=A0A504Z924_FASGI|nr:hypothetical protein FGIG_03708 [Fasciola gigantica]
MDRLRASASDSHELNSSDWTASELAEVDAVWCKLKLAEEWVELLDDSVQWNFSDFEDKNPSNRDRVALQSLRNLKIN